LPLKELRLEPLRVLYARGRLSFRRNGKDCGLNRAFSLGDTVSLCLYLPRQWGVKEVSLSLFYEISGVAEERIFRWEVLSDGFDVYSVTLPDLSAGIYRFGFSVKSAVGSAYLRRGSAFNELCAEQGAGEGYPFRFLVSEFLYDAPEWIYGGIIYHIFVDRFYRGGNAPLREGTIRNEDWENGIPQYPEYPGAPLANNMFFGGDLDGIIKKLDYLSTLGVSVLYLSPIFEAASNHKYDTGDYMKVDSMFGGDEAFMRLLSAAHEKGIRVILDGVFNHTGADSQYFNRYGHYKDSVGAYQSKESPYYSWYDFREFPNRYTAWWDIEILPRLMTDNEECQSFFVGENGVVDRWMKRGVDGFRLDVVDELSDTFVSRIKSRMNTVTPSSVLYGEVWEDASDKVAYGSRRSYYDGKELDGVMNYPLRRGLISYLRYGEIGELLYALTDVMYYAPKRIRDAQMNLLGTHDTERILTALAGDLRGDTRNAELAVKRMTEEQREKGISLLSLAYLILATLPGIPTVFYGDEAGLEGYGDPFNRLPFPWHKVEDRLLSVYQAIGKLRRRNAAYKKGDFRLLLLNREQLIFARDGDKHALVTVINRSENSLSLRLPKGSILLYGEKRCGNTLLLRGLSGAVLRIPKGSIFSIADK